MVLPVESAMDAKVLSLLGIEEDLYSR